MDGILGALNSWREGTEFPAVLVWLRVIVAALMGIAIAAATLAPTPDELLALLRAALRHAGYTDKQVAAEWGVSKGKCSEKLSGARPATIQSTFCKLPVPVFQWFLVEATAFYGVPVLVEAGARLARRQARMSLSHRSKVGVA